MGVLLGASGPASVASQPHIVQQRRRVLTKAGTVSGLSSAFSCSEKANLSMNVVWRCPNIGDEQQCPFFLWVDHEAAAKDWLKISQLPPFPQTPTKTGVSCNEPQTPKSPYTRSKRKMISRDTNCDDNGNCGNQNLDRSEDSLQPTMVPDDPFMPPRQDPEHTRKVARTGTLSTPGQRFTERLESCTVSAMTPPATQDHQSASNNMASRSRLVQSLAMSPTPGQHNDTTDLGLGEESDLTTTILDLIRSDNLGLKVSTEMRLRHAIGLKLDVSEIKLRRYRETISELYKRLHELEAVVQQVQV